MAGKKIREASIYQGTDMLYDYPCSTCEEDSLNAEAFYFCKQHAKQYCNKCIKLHDKFSEGHTILTKDKVQDWGVVTKKGVALQKCSTHIDKELDMYCEDHDTVCCYVCTTAQHRSCKAIKHVPDIAKGFLKKKSTIKSLESKVKKMDTKLNALKTKRQDSTVTLKKTCDSIKATIKKWREKINKLLDETEERSIKEVERVFTSMQESIRDQIVSCTTLHADMQELLHDIKNNGKDCEAFTFVANKLCEEKLGDAEGLLKIFNSEEFTIKFVPDKEIEEYISSLKMFGTFYTSPSATSSLDNKGPHTGQWETCSIAVEDMKLCPIKAPGEQKSCGVTGLCQTENGYTVLVDRYNSKLKLLNLKHVLLDVLVCRSSPFGICCTGGETMAATVWDIWQTRGELHFLTARDGKLKMTTKASLEHECTELATDGDQLYVGSADTIYIYTMAGKMVRRLYQDKSGGETVSKFAFNSSCSQLYITNPQRNLLRMLDLQGNQLASISDQSLRAPSGVCLGPDGRVFVCGRGSSTVYHIDGQLSTRIVTLLGKTDDVKEPATIYYRSETSELIVGQWDDFLLVFKLK